jgi:hypothetical protein
MQVLLRLGHRMSLPWRCNGRARGEAADLPKTPGAELVGKGKHSIPRVEVARTRGGSQGPSIREAAMGRTEQRRLTVPSNLSPVS